MRVNPPEVRAVPTRRESPPTRRVIAVLDWLAAQRGRRHTLSAIARGCELSPATCLGILNELSRAGYLSAHGDGTYGLGSALIAVGAAARDARPGLDRARRELAGLHRDLALQVTASAVVGDEIVVLEAVGRPADGAPVVDSGMLFPFVAPVGLMFVAWGTDDEVDAWLARSPVEFEGAKIDRLRAVIAGARRQGHLVERLTNLERNLHAHLGPDTGPDGATRQALALALSIFVDREYTPGELEAAGHGSVSVVVAPCFGADGRPEMHLGAYVMRDDVAAEEVAAIGRRVREAADAVTAALGGRDPWLAAAAP